MFCAAWALALTRVLSPRQLPTDHDHAVPTREYQIDQSSRLLLRCHRPCCPRPECSEPAWRERISPRRRGPNRGQSQGERNLRFLSPLESPFFPSGRSELTSRNVFPLRRPSQWSWVPERCSPSRVRFAAPKAGAPLTAPLRSGQTGIATGGSGGNTRRPAPKTKAGVPPVGRNAGPKQNTIKPGGA